MPSPKPGARIQRQADEATQAVLKGGRWLLVKNRENLTAEEGAEVGADAGRLAGTQDLLRLEGGLPHLV